MLQAPSEPGQLGVELRGEEPDAGCGHAATGPALAAVLQELEVALDDAVVDPRVARVVGFDVG